jgi:hypothetical protein
MHTIIVIIGGLALLGFCLGVAHALGGAAAAALGSLAFLPLWVIGSGINMYAGVRAGRSAAEEIPYLILVFAIPAGAACLAWWKLAHG